MGDIDVVISNIREECLARGFSGYKDFKLLFKTLDTDESLSLSRQEFLMGMKKKDFSQTEEELNAVFDKFDRDSNGLMDSEEFLIALRPPMSKGRHSLLQECYQSLDVVTDGKINIKDMRVLREKKAEKHPKFRSGEWTLDEVLQSYVDALAFAPRNQQETEVLVEDFIEYYEGLSASVDKDEHFERMMRICFGLD